MRWTAYILCVLWANTSFGQDSLLLDEVLITDSLVRKSSFNISPLESKFGIISLSKCINNNTPLIFRSNGLGGVASIINRGMPTGQMQMYWNGIPINNTVIGYTDLSIYNVDDFSSISQENHTTYGAPGGVIHLNSERQPEIKNGVFLSSSVGSFNYQNQHLSSILTSKKIQANIQVGFESSKNDFPYKTKTLSGETITVNQSNATFKRFHFSNAIYYNINKNNKLHFYNFWTQLDRELPNPIGIDEQDANLLDNVFISSVEYKNIRKKNSLNIKGAYYNSLIEYIQESANIYSNTRLHKGFFDGEWKRYFSEYLTFGVLGRHESNIAISNNFNGLKYLQTTSFGAKVNYKSKIQNIDIAILENIFSNHKPETSFFLSHKINPLKNNRLELSYALSRDVLFPTFNDYYWPVVGNTNLKSQKSIKAELALSTLLVSNEKWKGKTTVTGYVQKMNDFILWSPDSNFAGLWSPKNLQEVLSRGLEINTTFNYKKNKWKVDLNALYSFNLIENQVAMNSRDISVNRQLIYRPKHSLKINNQLSFGNYYLQINWQYFSDRTTIYSENPRPNREFLPAYHLADVSIGSMYTIKKWHLGWQFDVNNLYKTKYQEVQNFAVPTNHFLFTLKIQHYEKSN